jgi:6-phosphogluconolactonase (cycloisomerase 2 family)
LAALALIGVGGVAALAVSDQVERFVPVCALVDGQAGVDGVSQVASMAFADDRVYLSSQLDNCLTVVSRDEGGKLKVVEHVAREAQSPVPAGAKLVPAEQAVRVGGGRIAVSKDHRYLFIASDQNILVFERGEDEQLALRSAYGDPPNTIPYAGMLDFALSPDERFLLCNRLRDGVIEVLAFDRDAKQLTRVQEVSGLGRCEDLAMSPDGRHLYAPSRTNQLVYVFNIDPASGKLTKSQELKDRDCGMRTLKNVATAKVSPDGKLLVVSSVRNTGEVSVLSRDSESGKVVPVQHLTDKELGNADLNDADCIAFSDDAKTLFLGCRESHCVVVLSKEEKTSSFKPLETIRHPTIERPTCLEVDRGSLFVCSGESGAVTVFRINDRMSKPTEETMK